MEAGNISRGQVVPGVEEIVEWGWVAGNPPVMVQMMVCIPKALFHRPTYIHTNSLFSP